MTNRGEGYGGNFFKVKHRSETIEYNEDLIQHDKTFCFFIKWVWIKGTVDETVFSDLNRDFNIHLESISVQNDRWNFLRTDKITHLIRLSKKKKIKHREKSLLIF